MISLAIISLVLVLFAIYFANKFLKDETLKTNPKLLYLELFVVVLPIILVSLSPFFLPIAIVCMYITCTRKVQAILNWVKEQFKRKA